MRREICCLQYIYYINWPTHSEDLMQYRDILKKYMYVDVVFIVYIWSEAPNYWLNELSCGSLSLYRCGVSSPVVTSRVSWLQLWKPESSRGGPGAGGGGLLRFARMLEEAQATMTEVKDVTWLICVLIPDSRPFEAQSLGDSVSG